MEDLRYPVGEFHFPESVSARELATFIDQIAETPGHMRTAVAGLSDSQLDTPYRPGGWTVRQLAHHVPDSHINSYTRFRLALTEDEPVIKPYEEARWAELADARTLPIEPSLVLLESLHARWVPLLRSLSDAEWKRTFRHPELGLVRLEQNAALYAWHGRHHVAHITALRKRNGW
jgi:DinB family protein